MSNMVVSPYGVGLPHSSLFAVSRRDKVMGRLSRPSNYFWQKAVAPITPALEAQPRNRMSRIAPRTSNLNWIDLDAPAISGSEDEGSHQATAKKPKKSRSFAKLRQISFRSFVPSVGSTKNPTVVSTEIISKKRQPHSGSQEPENTYTIFNSWRIKSRGAKTEVKKMMAVVKDRISSFSPVEAHPKTWDEFHRLYADNQIDIINPPLPPMQPASEGAPPTAFQERLYNAPKPANEDVRQLVVNRLGLCGPRQFESSPEAEAKAKERLALGDKLLEQGQEPQSLDEPWEHRLSQSNDDGRFGIAETKVMLNGVLSGDLPPETLEQHPVFRKIVNQCRVMFGTWASFLSILDGDRQIFLAESGLEGMRETARHVSFCAHTVLNGRKGFAILDTHKDWRFEKNALTVGYGIRFYAGVPLIAPNLDGSPESEDNAVPLGTLCVVDTSPRGTFGPEERKKLVYMAEFARRELAQWFVKKMELKKKTLEASQEVWQKQLKQVASTDTATVEDAPEILSDSRLPAQDPEIFGGLDSSASSVSTPPTSPSSHDNVSLKSPMTPMGRSLFDDMSVVNQSKLQKVFDLATTLVGETLELSLVYLIAVAPNAESEELGRTRIISGHNIPLPMPVFDAGLHLRALRAPEGGLLYQNPKQHEAEEAALLPKLSSTEPGQTSSYVDPYASAMLVAVGAESPSNGGGFVLAGFTSDPKRVFGGEDVSYMKQFAHELAKYTCKLSL